jgi:hypothetical protein
LAKIGGRAITNADLARYQLVRELLVGASSYQQALDELCDRALLEREALANGITVTELELSQEVLRRKALIAATATARIPLPTEAPLGAANRSASWVGRARPNPLSLFDRAELILSERGLSEGELGAEVSVDLLALKAKRRLDIDRTASSPAQEEDAPRLAAVWGDLRAKWGVELFTR